MTWRSMLYVPANIPRFHDKAQTRGADALVLDLEDSVPADHKSEAREILQDRWEYLRKGPSDLIVRINSPIRSVVRDLEAVVRDGLSAVFVPKVPNAESIRMISGIIGELEAEHALVPGGIRIIPMIETPVALEAVFEIAASDGRICGLMLGSEDFATACGMQPSSKNLFAARQRIVLAARAAGIAPYGLLDSIAGLSRDDWAERAAQARDFGFTGATAIHPDAIEGLNTGFSPSPDELDWARRVLATLDQAAMAGRGAAPLDGKMIDMPMQLRAQALLAGQKNSKN